MEAALRTAYSLSPAVSFPFRQAACRPHFGGLEQIKKRLSKSKALCLAYSHLEGATVRVAVTSGLARREHTAQAGGGRHIPVSFHEGHGLPGRAA
jgi:hypothetical protein